MGRLLAPGLEFEHSGEGLVCTTAFIPTSIHSYVQDMLGILSNVVPIVQTENQGLAPRLLQITQRALGSVWLQPLPFFLLVYLLIDNTVTL